MVMDDVEEAGEMEQEEGEDLAAAAAKRMELAMEMELEDKGATSAAAVDNEAERALEQEMEEPASGLQGRLTDARASNSNRAPADDTAQAVATPLRVGQRVEARYCATHLGAKRTMWYCGTGGAQGSNAAHILRISGKASHMMHATLCLTVARVHEDGRCDVQYVDGDFEAQARAHGHHIYKRVCRTHRFA